jgi:hypothetical protein
MRTNVVVFLDPAIDCGLGLVRRLKPVGVQDFVAKRAVETFVISILPWRPWVNVNGLNADAFDPCLEYFEHKFWAVI